MSHADRLPSSRRFWQVTLAVAVLAASSMLVYSALASWRLIFGGPQGGDNAFLTPLSLAAAAFICFVVACGVAGGVALVACTARAIWQLRTR